MGILRVLQTLASIDSPMWECVVYWVAIKRWLLWARAWHTISSSICDWMDLGSAVVRDCRLPWWSSWHLEYGLIEEYQVLVGLWFFFYLLFPPKCLWDFHCSSLLAICRYEATSCSPDFCRWSKNLGHSYTTLPVKLCSKGVWEKLRRGWAFSAMNPPRIWLEYHCAIPRNCGFG